MYGLSLVVQLKILESDPLHLQACVLFGFPEEGLFRKAKILK